MIHSLGRFPLNEKIKLFGLSVWAIQNLNLLILMQIDNAVFYLKLLFV